MSEEIAAVLDCLTVAVGLKRQVRADETVQWMEETLKKNTEITYRIKLITKFLKGLSQKNKSVAVTCMFPQLSFTRTSLLKANTLCSLTF